MMLKVISVAFSSFAIDVITTLIFVFLKEDNSSIQSGLTLIDNSNQVT